MGGGWVGGGGGGGGWLLASPVVAGWQDKQLPATPRPRDPSPITANGVSNGESEAMSERGDEMETVEVQTAGGTTAAGGEAAGGEELGKVRELVLKAHP